MSELRVPERKVPLARQVADQIQSMITSGDWPVGYKIPAEHDLVEKFEVSRNTIREALRALVHAQLLEARVGDGTYVRSASEIEQPLITRAARSEFEEVLEVRAALECRAARLAALRRTPEDAIQLRELLEVQREASRAPDRSVFTTADTRLHREVVAIAGNELLAELYDHLGTALAASIEAMPWTESLAVEHDRNHAALVDAIVAGRPDDAERAAAKLVETSKGDQVPERSGRLRP
ncbi:FadR/GntR family transcriptional regulator [Pseudonocardia phyllosphaerae]|uniref:FadR/GntR family transcriptional regulator n=1 Tax=Pseudonocardia phyllosphaerae TaxID=3390502 RepID=UPI00397AA1A6